MFPGEKNIIVLDWHDTNKALSPRYISEQFLLQSIGRGVLRSLEPDQTKEVGVESRSDFTQAGCSRVSTQIAWLSDCFSLFAALQHSSTSVLI